MRPQVTTTGSVIGTGPTVNNVFVARGDPIMTGTPNRRTAVRAARMPAAATSSGNAPNRLAMTASTHGNEREANELSAIDASRSDPANRKHSARSIAAS